MDEVKPFKRRIKFPYAPSEKVFDTNHGPSLTVQSEAASCDIRNIMARYERTGMVDHINSFEGRYEDYRDFPESYQDALNTVMAGQESFSELPARIRDAFANDPYLFFQAVHDPAQQDRLIQLGVFTKREEPPKGVDDAKASSTPSEASKAS